MISTQHECLFYNIGIHDFKHPWSKQRDDLFKAKEAVVPFNKKDVRQRNCTLGDTLMHNVEIFVSLFTSLQPLIALEQRKSLNFYGKQFCASFILCLNSHIHLTLSA